MDGVPVPDGNFVNVHIYLRLYVSVVPFCQPHPLSRSGLKLSHSEPIFIDCEHLGHSERQD